jgi:hypothetical protein
VSYSSNNPPRQILAFSFAGAGGIWLYESTDAHATVEGASYFSDGGKLGLRVGDLLCAVKTSATVEVTWHRVNSVTAPTLSSNGPATVSAATLA